MDIFQKISLALFFVDMAIFLFSLLYKFRKINLYIVESVFAPVLAVIIFFSVQPRLYLEMNHSIHLVGLLLLLFGVILGQWAYYSLGRNVDGFWEQKNQSKQRTVITTGLYNKIRHPVYTSLFLSYGGLVLTLLHPISIALYIVGVLVLIYTARNEEQYLIRLFPEYAVYSKRTGRFFPKLGLK